MTPPDVDTMPSSNKSPLMMAIASSLKKLRVRNDLSQEQLGKKLGIARSFISGIEGCKRNITIETLDRLLTHLDSSYVSFVNYLEKELSKYLPEFSEDNQSVQQMYSEYWNQVLESNRWYTVTNEQGHILRASDQFYRTMEYSPDEVIHQDHRIFKSGQHSSEFMRELWQTILANKTFTAAICNRTKSGKLVWFDTKIFPVSDPVSAQKYFVALRTLLPDGPKS